ncbi:MAG TPA: hypothetical protein PK393_04255 [Synergistaceae bacterium]|nr:hypothetical protein [Synergistaceae bacterium]HQF91497.1 hypothetical protein [Synergistaceae bacterium]HQK24715.1 hypothetical protein [Synergistaceae bacterium]
MSVEKTMMRQAPPILWGRLAFVDEGLFRGEGDIGRDGDPA